MQSLIDIDHCHLRLSDADGSRSKLRSDPKNLVYFFQEDREDPGHFSFYEVFATKQDFEAHNNMPYVKEWFAKLPELAECGVHATRMEIKSAAGRQG